MLVGTRWRSEPALHQQAGLLDPCCTICQSLGDERELKPAASQQPQRY